MFNDNKLSIGQLEQLIDRTAYKINTLLPSEWAENNIIIKDGDLKGPLRYRNSPYTREIVNCFAEDHPARYVTVMKGQQIGLSSSVLIPILCFLIANTPGNTIFTVGSSELIKKASNKLDFAIKIAGLEGKIQPETILKANNKTGNTTTLKEFIGGWIQIMTLNNHDDIADFSCKYGLLDDLDRNTESSKSFGDTTALIEGRFSAHKLTKKIFRISTPGLKETSMIEPSFLLGDQRKFIIPCPVCHDFIELLWEHPGGGGMYWNPESKNVLSTVGYICPECAGFFKENNKMIWLNDGIWKPTAEPIQPYHYSYKLSSLYAPTFMTGWKEYVGQYLEFCPKGVIVDRQKYKTFKTTILGDTYEEEVEAPSAKTIQSNTPTYEIGTVPVLRSIRDGNGRIVLLTFASDLNGKMRGYNKATEDDVRLDWEIVAHSESGATYSVCHGSIGTFVPRENSLSEKAFEESEGREKWTAELFKPNSIWPELVKIIQKPYPGDDGEYICDMPVIDVGHLSDFIYPFLDWYAGKWPVNPCVGIRGDKDEAYLKESGNHSLYTIGKGRHDIYYIKVGLFKDMLSYYMTLRHDPRDPCQPPNYMNFPIPSGGLYLNKNFFDHFESEHKQLITDKAGAQLYRWVRKGNAPNHQWDCRVYNLAVKEIKVKMLGKELKAPVFEWPDYAKYVSERMPPIQ